MSIFGTAITEINMTLQVIKELHYLTEIIPELQEGKKQQIIRAFRVRMIDKLLNRIKDLK